MVKKLFVLLFFLFGCGSSGVSDRLELRTFFLTGAYDKGLEFLSKSKFYSDEKSKLLSLMERGLMQHFKGDYEQSWQTLEEARILSDKLYTVSLSKKAEKAILNDTFDLFYGEVYERSMIYFYLSLNSLLQYQKTKKSDDLFRARASVVGWDAYLASIKEERLGKTVYKNDLLLKLYGARVHELVGSPEDLQIASILYKDAKDILFKNYNTYPSFNSNYKEFKRDYDKLASMPIEEVKKNYVNPTDFQKSLTEYIDHRIELSKNKNKKNNGKFTFTLLLQKGIIAEKVADKNFYSLDFLAKEPLMAMFVADVLGLMPNRNTYNPGGAYMGMATATVALNAIGIGFELPKIVNLNPPKKLSLNVYDLTHKIVLSKDITLVNPMGDIAEEAIYEQSSSTYARVGARLAAKHAAAIAGAFATYKAAGGGSGNNDFFAKNLAVLGYAGSSKVIEESEKADVRYWSTLPNEFRLVDLEMAPGSYLLELEYSPTDKSDLGGIVVEAQSANQLISLRKN